MALLNGIQVGDHLPMLKIAPITRTTLALFAGGSGDHNPVHIDTDFAKAAGFGDVFCHGMLSMAYLGRLLTQWVPQDSIRTFSARFTAITPVGAAPSCSGFVTKIEPRGDRQLVTVELQVELPDGTATLVGEAVVEI